MKRKYDTQRERDPSVSCQIKTESFCKWFCFIGWKIAPFGIAERVQREKLSNVGATVRLLQRGDGTSQVCMGDVGLSVGFCVVASTCRFVHWGAAWGSRNLPNDTDLH